MADEIPRAIGNGRLPFVRAALSTAGVAGVGG